VDQTTLIINRVLPILILIGLGYWIRQRQFLAESTIEDLRKAVVNFALPSVLFISFLNMELKTTYIVVFVVIFMLCVVMFGLGGLLKRRFDVQYVYFPFLMTGFEYGMLGVSLFGGAYGLDKIGYIAVVDLGHELFIWFVFLAFLLTKRDGLQSPRQLTRVFFRSPVIIGILAGLLFNVLDASEFLYERAFTGALMATCQFLGNLTIPLILIIVGHGIKFDREGIRAAVPVIAVRMAILIPLALVLNVGLIRGWLDLEKPFETALFTLLILPPPFIIPLYMRPGLVEERRYINNVLTLYTIVSITIFALYFVLNPGIS
jgi:predicted permease